MTISQALCYVTSREQPASLSNMRGPMVLRTANIGNNKGSKFYECSNNPRCREIMQLTTTEVA